MSSSSSSSLSPSPVSAPAGQTAITFRGIAAVAGVLITFAALTLIVLLHCYCDEWRRGALTTSASGRGRRRRSGSGGDGGRGGGVDPEVLPVTVYSRAAAAAAAKEDGVECAVCLAKLEDGEEARFLRRCGHGFHAECVDMWLGSHSTCPLCRLTVVVPPPPLLPPVPPEPPASYTVNLPETVLLGLSDQGAPAR
nr:putative RING-H2 finger protein ATL4O precursor [Oryza sativa Japonica Group]